jgi:concentrative nucleoside transporter, CNT family
MALWLLLLTSALASDKGNFIVRETTILDRGMSFVGLFALVGIAWLMSENRSKVNWKPVAWGVGLQLVFGLVVLSETASGFFYTVIDGGVKQLLSFAEAGATFVFGTIEAHKVVVGPPGELFSGGGTEEVFIGRVSPAMKTFAFWILPTIVFFSSLMSLLYHVGVMQVIVRAIAWLMVRTLGTSGAESLSAAGNIFVGQTEAPLLVKPFVATMTRSELMAVMTGGFATVAGGVMGAYVQFLAGVPNIAGHLVMASIMSAPAALAVAKVMVPELETPKTAGVVDIEFEKTATNAIEAAANGASEGIKLAINVAAMLIAIVGLVAMFDWMIGYTPITFCPSGVVGGYSCGVDQAGNLVVGEALSMARILGWVFAPIALLMGIPWSECFVVGRLLGEKIVLTEFVAYINLGSLIHSEVPMLSERSAVIASYGLCGFANFASIGIQLGGIGGIAPERMGDLASLGFRAMLAGVLAACMTGAVAGIMINV